MAWALLMTAAACIPLSVALGNALDVPLHGGRALGLVLLAGIAGAGLPSVLFLVGSGRSAGPARASSC